MNIFRLELSRALGSKGFLAGAAGFVLCALLGVWRPILDVLSGGPLHEPGYALECASEALRSKYLILALPAVAALPYAASFVDDAASRFLRSYLPRCGRRAFAASRTAATALSGAAVMAVSGAAVVGILMLVLLPQEMRPNPLMREDTEALRTALAIDIMRQILLLSLSGMLWALVGALAAALSMNRHIALAAPFILYYLLIILSTRYFPDLEVFDPQLWAQGGGIWQDVPFAAAAQVLELSTAGAFFLSMMLGRRIRDV